MTSRLVRASQSEQGSIKRAWQIILPGLALAVVGCAARPTGYVDASRVFRGPYGYSVTPMGRDEYSILVRANSVTPDERVAQIALLRAAHLTVEKGGSQFSIIHSESLSYRYQSTNSVNIRGVPILVSMSLSEDKLAALVIHISMPGTTAVAPDTIDAQQLVADLSAKLQR